MRQGQVSPTCHEIRERLTNLIHEIAKIPTNQITDAATVDQDLRMESVAFVEICVAIEEEYDIEIDPIHVVQLNQFAAIVDYICGFVLSRSERVRVPGTCGGL